MIYSGPKASKYFFNDNRNPRSDNLYIVYNDFRNLNHIQCEEKSKSILKELKATQQDVPKMFDLLEKLEALAFRMDATAA